MLTFFLDKNLDTPLYEQLYLAIKKEIEVGNLKKNEKLPSKRKLGAHLEISQTTVETAYAQLLAEGYIKAKPKVGFFVTTNLDFLSKTKTSKFKKTVRKINKEYEIDFKTNQVDAADFPYKVFAKIERDTVLDQLSQHLNRGDSFGLYELRERIADILFSYRGIKARPEQIVIGSGSEHLILLLVLLLGREKVYAVEDPSYIKNYQLYQAYGVNVKTITLDNQGLRMDELSNSRAEIVHTTPSHQFPKGIVTQVERRLELIKWASEKSSRYLIEDDYDSEFRFFGSPIPAMKVMDRFEKVIYLNSFSKTLAPSFRLSYMVLPERLIDIYHEKLSFFSSSVPLINQLVMEQFIRSGEYEKHLNRMKNTYKLKRDYLINLLNNSGFNSKIKVYGEEAGLHFLVDINSDFSENALVEMAKKYGVRVYGLSEYSLSSCNMYHVKTVVFGYSNLTTREMEKGVAKLEVAWKNI
jgi:GntR family transcriptional regulator/MocR family aminotransferase